MTDALTRYSLLLHFPLLTDALTRYSLLLHFPLLLRDGRTHSLFTASFLHSCECEAHIQTLHSLTLLSCPACSVNHIAQDGRSPLHRAAANRHVPVMRLLIAGWSPLALPWRCGNVCCAVLCYVSRGVVVVTLMALFHGGVAMCAVL